MLSVHSRHMHSPPPPHLNFQKKNVCPLFFKIKLIFVVYKLYKFSVQINDGGGVCAYIDV